MPRDLTSGDRQPDDLQFEVGLRPRRLEDFTGQSKLKENLSIAIERRPHARRSHGPRAALRPAGLGQNHARLHHRRGTGGQLQHHLRARPAEEARPHRHSHQHPRAPGLLHRRDPPPAARRRGDALLRARRFPHGYPGRHGPGRAHPLHAHPALHRHRRHHPPGPGQRAPARPLRTGAAAGPLRCARAARRSSNVPPQLWRGHRGGRRRGDRAPLPGHAAHRQPPAAPRPRLCPGARRRPHRR